ncbi:MAG TPA: hypothetical protein VE869_02785 [Gemmatimonas sp.]|nr:hypothetical protein [Gemmatimonas sp.]
MRSPKSQAGGKLALLALIAAVLPWKSAGAQPDQAAQTFRTARATALQGGFAAAATAFTTAAAQAKATRDQAVEVAAMRGLADLQELQRPCTDSAQATLRAALRVVSPGDRSAPDALVRLLASRGDVDAARQILVETYADVPAVGRSITTESMRFLQGQAAVQFAGGQESAALSTLGMALTVAARLRDGDARDSVASPTGEVDRVNAWLLFDLAMLRLHAKSPSIRQPATAKAILDRLVAAPASTLDGGEEEAYPITRIGDRLFLQAHAKGQSLSKRTGC